MKLRQKDIDRLEVMFAKDCQVAIDTLAYHGMSEEQYTSFENCLKTFSKYSDLKDFISESLLLKIKEASRLFYPEKKENWFSFRKLVRLLVKFCDEESIDVFVSFLLTGRRPHHFFILLEEMIEHNINTASAQNVFESLISVHNYSLEIIDNYLSIIKQDAYGLVINLMRQSRYAGLIRYIRELNYNSRNSVLKEQVVPSIIGNYTGDRTHYLAITMAVIEGGIDLIQDLLTKSGHIGPAEKYFSGYLAANQIQNLQAIKNFMAYLEIHNPSAIRAFEDHLLKDTRPYLIVQYAVEVPNSNKRKVLLRLVELKDEKFIVEFIKKFPAFSSLLPML